ncbi:winged helix-turn-helix transcriptional regulator [Rubrobacter taiwanensis]|uniref:Winged helix-turn-helix transcriptional regulator n=1 Tax=Rubrobacter taiwanensis TaxID=185139 RepID=A0A4R1BS30_9ACTN|nr:IclR family transcriptional regulator C-terminal domain-containing protein [Rubrobacter taiwanensis]TCJ20584.1 winged helix-turn-helix transcriptional regulator [Rubrobacter taiwanensis]
MMEESVRRDLARTGGDRRSKFRSARRVFRALEIISEREGVTARQLAGELGVSLSNCYYILNVLLEGGYIERAGARRGYRLGPKIPLLYERAFPRADISGVELVVRELAERSMRHAYLGILADGAVTVAHLETPPRSPPVGIVQGFHGASHALALGKVLIAGAGREALTEYLAEYPLEAFTPRTIVEPKRLEEHLRRVREIGFATDIEEFSENLCCVAAPIELEDGSVAGAIGVSTSARRFVEEAGALRDLVRWAAGEAARRL